MELDSRPLIILQMLAKQKKISINKLMQDLKLTNRQLEYDLKKIDSYLKHNGYGFIQREDEGLLHAPQNIQSLLISISMNKKLINLSSEERKYTIVLHLFINNEIISLFHISSLLKVSKNTILQDISQINNYIKKYDVVIKYSRQSGYYLQGNEIDKRLVSYKFISLLFGTENGKIVLNMLIETEEDCLLSQCQKTVTDLQSIFNYNFIEQEKNEFIFFIAYLSLHFRKNKDSVNKDENVKYYIKKREYEASSYVAKKLLLRHEEEEIYFISKLLSGLSIGDYEKDTFIYKEKLLDSIHHVIINFEEMTGFMVKDKSDITRNLYNHLVPTYYRLLFNIPITNPLLQTIKEEYESIFIIVEKVLYPIEDALNYLLPDEEIGYITLHLGASLEKKYSYYTAKKSAIIVCPNGIGTSNLIKNELTNLFPDISFKGVFPPELITEKKIPYHDIIFSSVLLDVKQPLFIIKPIMNNLEKAYLVREVYSRIYNMYPLAPQLELMMNAINKYTYVYDQENLKKEINDIIKWKSNRGEWRPMLSELINKNTIQLKANVSDWEHAVITGGQLLVRENIVSEEYVKAMVKSVKDSGPYIVIAKNVALPHARPEEGAKEIGISILTLSTPVPFGNSDNDPVKYVFCLSAKNNDTHIKAMSELVQLLEKDSFYEALESTKPSDVINYIKKFEKENLL